MILKGHMLYKLVNKFDLYSRLIYKYINFNNILSLVNNLQS